MKLERPISLLLVLALLWGCGGEQAGSETATKASSVPMDVCALLTQAEIDSLFGESAGPGRKDSPVASIQGCAWPADGVPKFILQVVAASPDVAEAINPGEGYRVIELDGLGGKAAVAIQQANPKFGLEEGVAILGIVKGDRMLTLSPVKLNIREGTPAFDLLKQLADSAAGRL